MNKCRITVLKTTLDEELAREYGMVQDKYGVIWQLSHVGSEMA